MVNTGKLKWNTSIPLEYRAQMEYGGIRLYSTALLIYYINIQTVRHYILQTLPGIFPEYTLLSSPLLTCCRTPAPPRSSSHASASRKRADRRACAQSARLMPHASPPSGRPSPSHASTRRPPHSLAIQLAWRWNTEYKPSETSDGIHEYVFTM